MHHLKLFLDGELLHTLESEEPFKGRLSAVEGFDGLDTINREVLF